MLTKLINGLISKIFTAFIRLVMKGIVYPSFKIAYEITVATISYYLYQMAVLMLTLIDFISDIFRMIAGLDGGLYFKGIKNAFTGKISSNDGIPVATC